MTTQKYCQILIHLLSKLWMKRLQKPERFELIGRNCCFHHDPLLSLKSFFPLSSSITQFSSYLPIYPRPFPTFEKVLWRLLMWRNKPSPQIHHHFNSPGLLMKWQIIYEQLFSFSRWFILAQVITIHQVKSLPTALISILIPQFGYTTISLDYSALPWDIYMKSGFYLDFIFGVNYFLSIVM